MRRIPSVPVLAMVVSAVLLIAPAAAEEPDPAGSSSQPAAVVAQRYEGVEASLRRLLGFRAAPERDVPPVELTVDEPPSDGAATDSFATRVAAIGAAGQRAIAAARADGDETTAAGVTSALAHVQGASDDWQGGETDVLRVMSLLRRALAEGLVGLPGDVAELRGLVVDLSSFVARGFFDHAVASGADRVSVGQLDAAWETAQAAFASGDDVGGAQALEDGVGFAQPKIVFDLPRFRSNVEQTFAFPQVVVGSTWGIYKDGALAGAGQQGFARVPNDGSTLQQSSKEMNIASVTKTFTAVLTLRKLDELSPLGIEQKIAPYLPAHWELGDGVEDLTFEDLLTQKSGMDENLGPANTYSGLDYAGLRKWIAYGVKLPKTFDYQNQNFAILRVMLPKMYGLPIAQPSPISCFFDPESCEALRDSWYAASTESLYRYLMQQHVFGPAGINGDCKPTEPLKTRTLMYRVWPINPLHQLGLDPGNWRPICGAGGWYLSALEVARFASTVRNGNLLSATERSLMNTRFLGWMDPLDWTGWGQGPRGTYHNHGGDLGCCYPHEAFDSHEPGPFTTHPRRGLHSCLMSFPNNVQAAVLVNSQNLAGYPGGPYQCASLETAWENAWVWQQP